MNSVAAENLPYILEAKNLSAGFNQTNAIEKISLGVVPNTATAIIGPSGCGKSTFIRCLNRLHEEVPTASASGVVLFEGQDIYSKEIDPVELRRKMGMVFQKPNPFPAFSVFDNVAMGLKLGGVKDSALIEETVEQSLIQAALWNEVKDKLHVPGTSLSGGQQQRLCIARALAIDPHLLLMDEPTSALDPISTAKIEELIVQLKEKVTIVIVTHNMQQAARVADFTAFFLMGRVVEYDRTSNIFTNPKEKETEQYITGRFG